MDFEIDHPINDHPINDHPIEIEIEIEIDHPIDHLKMDPLGPMEARPTCFSWPISDLENYEFYYSDQLSSSRRRLRMHFLGGSIFDRFLNDFNLFSIIFDR